MSDSPVKQAAVNTADQKAVIPGLPSGPAELAQWVCWCFAGRDGEQTKIPLNPKTGELAQTDDPSTWATYTDALAAYNRAGGYAGVGFVFDATDPYVGIDLDHCLNPDGSVKEWARPIVDALSITYGEISPSNAGLKFFGRGKLPAGRRLKRWIGADGSREAVEMFDDGKYFTVTGRHFHGTATTIEDCGEVVATWHAKLFPEQPAAEPTGRIAGNDPGDGPVVDRVTADPYYAGLWRGETNGYPSHSEADLALMGRIGFFVGWDAGRMEQVFDRSALADRDKWGRRDYRDGTIRRAREGKSASFDWQVRDDDSEATTALQIAAQAQVKADPSKTDGGNGTPADGDGNGRGKAREFPLTDIGNGERLIERHGPDIRYCPAWKAWLVWNGRCWKVDESGEIDRLAKETVRAMKVEASRLEDKGEAERLWKHAHKTEANRKIKDMIERAQKEHGVAIAPDDLDRDPFLFNTPDGTIELRTLNVRPHRRDDFITKLCAVRYDQRATAPTWDKVLRQIFNERNGLIDFVRRAVGYTMTGDVSERCIIILHGVGSNGKSTLLGSFRELLGPYAAHIRSEVLMLKHGDGGIPNDIARLKGARFVSAVESDDGKRLAESLLKQMTGGEDVLTARFMRAEWFDFKPEFKIFLATNHRPEIRGTDDAVWDRIRLVPFDVRFFDTPEEAQRECGDRSRVKDKSLAAKLRAELPGILNWALLGCLEWQRFGLAPPTEVIAATQSYRTEMDVIGDFLNSENCVKGPKCECGATLLYKAYEMWCKLNELKPATQKKFGMQLREKGFQSGDDSNTNLKIWRGIGLATTADSGPSG